VETRKTAAKSTAVAVTVTGGSPTIFFVIPPEMSEAVSLCWPVATVPLEEKFACFDESLTDSRACGLRMPHKLRIQRLASHYLDIAEADSAEMRWA
jgi:hypothetical protein